MSHQNNDLKTFLCILSTFFVGLSLTACSPGFGTKLNLQSVAPLPADAGISWRGLRLCVLEVEDARPSKTLAFVGKRPLEPTGDASRMLQESLKASLEAEGALIRCDQQTPSLSVVIRRWLAEVAPAFPATELFAAATVEVETRQGIHVLYKATYQGTSSLKHPFTQESHAHQVLEEALQEAQRALRNDEKLKASLKVPY